MSHHCAILEISAMPIDSICRRYQSQRGQVDVEFLLLHNDAYCSTAGLDSEDQTIEQAQSDGSDVAHELSYHLVPSGAVIEYLE